MKTKPTSSGAEGRQALTHRGGRVTACESIIPFLVLHYTLELLLVNSKAACPAAFGTDDRGPRAHRDAPSLVSVASRVEEVGAVLPNTLNPRARIRAPA